MDIKQSPQYRYRINIYMHHYYLVQETRINSTKLFNTKNKYKRVPLDV